MKYYYKIVQGFNPVGEVIETNNCIDKNRVIRNNALKTCFQKAYNFSMEFNLPIVLVLNEFLLKSNQFQNSFIKRIKYLLKSRDLVKEMKKGNFSMTNEYYLFIDFVLEKERRKLEIEGKHILPSRFKSSFFFESEADCKEYLSQSQNLDLHIIKVEFIEEKLLKKFDNNMISEFPNEFTAIDYDFQCKQYLNGVLSDNPKIEVVFQGKYKVICYIT